MCCPVPGCQPPLERELSLAALSIRAIPINVQERFPDFRLGPQAFFFCCPAAREGGLASPAGAGEMGSNATPPTGTPLERHLRTARTRKPYRHVPYTVRHQ